MNINRSRLVYTKLINGMSNIEEDFSRVKA